MSQLRLSRLYLVLLLALASPLLACGDDDGGADAGMDAGGDGDGSSVGDGDGDLRPRVTPDGGGMGDPGDGIEGAPCNTVADCGQDFSCVANIFNVGVCARPCTSAMDCNTDEFERCLTYTQFEADAHCVNDVEEEYGLCGVADTSICAGNRECLYFPDLPLGVCVDLCPLAGGDGADGGDDSDGGLPTGLINCDSEQTCLDILANAAGAGVCGTVVDRGAECGLDVGLYCEEGDLCRRQDPENFDEAPVCRQDCSATLECDEGDCTRLDLDTRVCI